jgi:hypothetical protein
MDLIFNLNKTYFQLFQNILLPTYFTTCTNAPAINQLLQIPARHRLYFFTLISKNEQRSCRGGLPPTYSFIDNIMPLRQ